MPVLLYRLDEALNIGAVRVPDIRSRSFERLVHLTSMKMTAGTTTR